VSTVGPVFDTGKLDWLNATYIRSLPDDELADRIIEFVYDYVPTTVEKRTQTRFNAVLRAAIPIIRERLTLLSDAAPMIDYLLVSAADLVIADDARDALPENTAAIIATATAALTTVAETDWHADEIQATLRTSLVEGLGLKPKVAFNPIRTAIAGRKVSPPLFESMEILGKEESLARLTRLG
jgi:glutamyl-tRNA synthetase